MLIKHRLQLFVTNWLGVIIAAVITLVTGTLGVTYVQISSRLDYTLAFATQLITLRFPDGMVLTDTLDSPPGYVFHVVVQVGDESSIPAEVTLSDMEVVLDGVPIVINRDGQWTKTVAQASGGGTGFENFEGDFTIDSAAFAGLVAKGTVDVDITMHVDAAAKYAFVRKSASKDFDIHMPGIPFKLITPVQP